MRGLIRIYKVLLVDDSRFIRKWIGDILNRSNRYKVIAEASNGREALLKYDEYRPDLVIMDVSMDEMNGVQALKHIVNLYPGAKIVMCTSLGQSSIITECMKAGAKDFIVKPYLDKLLDVLDQAIG